MSIKWFLYKIALKYIGWCNRKPSDIMYGHLKKMDRLTYHDCYKAYLLYGADAEWCKFKKYEVLDNAIQKLAEYEDMEERESVDPLMSLRKICDIIDMPWALNGGKEFTVGVNPDLDKQYVLCNGYHYDTRVGMFILIRSLAVRFDDDCIYKNEEYILSDGDLETMIGMLRYVNIFNKAGLKNVISADHIKAVLNKNEEEIV
mgnify:CR=1 FL=1